MESKDSNLILSQDEKMRVEIYKNFQGKNVVPIAYFFHGSFLTSRRRVIIISLDYAVDCQGYVLRNTNCVQLGGNIWSNYDDLFDKVVERLNKK
jgi:hypothetical protein